jgi:hypothetical protein
VKNFDGLSGLNLSEITLVPKNADTLFKIKQKQVNLWQLLTGDAVGNSRSSNGFVQLVKKGKSRNFDAFLKKIPQTNKKRDYADFLCSIIKILNLVPTDMVLDNLLLK